MGAYNLALVYFEAKEITVLLTSGAFADIIILPGFVPIFRRITAVPASAILGF